MAGEGGRKVVVPVEEREEGRSCTLEDRASFLACCQRHHRVYIASASRPPSLPESQGVSYPRLAILTRCKRSKW